VEAHEEEVEGQKAQAVATTGATWSSRNRKQVCAFMGRNQQQEWHVNSSSVIFRFQNLVSNVV
jgi:hypothetical protein